MTVSPMARLEAVFAKLVALGGLGAEGIFRVPGRSAS